MYSPSPHLMPFMSPIIVPVLPAAVMAPPCMLAAVNINPKVNMCPSSISKAYHGPGIYMYARNLNP